MRVNALAGRRTCACLVLVRGWACAMLLLTMGRAGTVTVHNVWRRWVNVTMRSK